MHLYDSYAYGLVGCGSTAVSLLTGQNPFEVRKMIKSPIGNCPDTLIRRCLRKFGISSYKVTKANLTNHNLTDDGKLKYHLKDDNVLLASQLFKKGEASWGIYWNGLFIHNFEVKTVNVFDILNFPILSAYVLFKPSWKIS